jgi:beta-lactamase class A
MISLGRRARLAIRTIVLLLLTQMNTLADDKGAAPHPFDTLTPDYATPCDPGLQAKIETIDTRLREAHGMNSNQTAVGLLDLRGPRLAMLRPDLMMYGASVPKITILLAYFEQHPEAARHCDPAVRQELGLMIKQSSNELAAKYSRQLGLSHIQQVIERYGFYDAARGGGLWMGKHYGQDDERRGDPLMDHSHAATVRQLLRFYLLLEQGRLVSQEASTSMREIFMSQDTPHKPNKFVKGLAGRDVQILRKSGTWEQWLHDSAIIIGPDRHYILAALTQHPEGDTYLEELAVAVDDRMARAGEHQ